MTGVRSASATATPPQQDARRQMHIVVHLPAEKEDVLSCAMHLYTRVDNNTVDEDSGRRGGTSVKKHKKWDNFCKISFCKKKFFAKISVFAKLLQKC
jgi:hypothetical protein